MSKDVVQAMASGAQQVDLRAGPLSFALVRIPPGEFDLGSPAEEQGHQSNEEPARRIRITKPFYLGRYEVTQGQYQAIMGVNPSEFTGDDLAIDQLTYSQALEFCDKLSQRSGLHVTLPTEAQWEYACRAGTRTRFYSGDTPAALAAVAWFAGNAANTVHPVGQKRPNAWGLYDILGNVWEPCLDCLPAFEHLPAADPIGTVRPLKGIMRGGGWMHDADYCRAACRIMTNDRFAGLGVRIAVNPER